MDEIEQAFNATFPTWEQLSKGTYNSFIKVVYGKGELRVSLSFSHYTKSPHWNNSIAKVFRLEDSHYIFFETCCENSHEEALLSVKEYLDKAFPGMS